MSNDLKKNVTNNNIWMRLLFMVIFAIIFCIIRVILAAVIVVQFLWVLFTSDKNTPLLSFGSQLATYIYQIYRYLSFNTEKRPFPFDDFPPADALLDDSIEEMEPAKEEATTQDEKEEAAVEPTINEAEENKAVDVASETGVETETKDKP